MSARIEPQQLHTEGVVQPPEELMNALRKGNSIVLVTTNTGNPAVGLHGAGNPLWVLEGFTDQAAHYFIDNFVEPYGYAPADELAGVWIRNTTNKEPP